MKKITLILMLLVAGLTFAQGDADTTPDVDLRPYRIGLKFGSPNIASVEFEYVTPLLNNRVAPFVNYINVSRTIDDVDANLNTFEIGSNIYFSRNNEGRGLYGALSYQTINAKLEIEDYEADNGDIYEGKAKSEIAFNAFNVKVGAKLGRKFFFRTEFGYSFGALPETINVEGRFNGQEVTDSYDITEDIEDVPVITQNGFPIFNIGFGFAF